MSYPYQLQIVNSIEALFKEERFPTIIEVLERFPIEHNNKTLYRYLILSYVYTGQSKKVYPVLKKLEDLSKSLYDHWFLFNLGKMLHCLEYQRKIWKKIRKNFGTHYNVRFYSLIWDNNFNPNYEIPEHTILPFLDFRYRKSYLIPSIYEFLINKFKKEGDLDKVCFYEVELMNHLEFEKAYYTKEDHYSIFDFLVNAYDDEAIEHLIESIKKGSIKALVTFYSHSNVIVGRN